MAQSRKQAADGGGRYRKEELLRADRFRTNRDAAEAVLDSGRTYTLQEAEDEIGNFMKGKVE